MAVSNGRVRGTLRGSLTHAGVECTIPNGITFSSRKPFHVKENFANPISIISDSLSPSNYREVSKSTCEASKSSCEASKGTCEASKSTREASQSTCEASQSTCEASKSTSEASKSSCKALVEDPPNPSNEVVESRLLWRKICWQLQGRFVRINKEKCALLHRWFNARGELPRQHTFFSSDRIVCSYTIRQVSSRRVLSR